MVFPVGEPGPVSGGGRKKKAMKLLTNVERLRLLTKAERAGLLSAAERAGCRCRGGAAGPAVQGGGAGRAPELGLDGRACARALGEGVYRNLKHKFGGGRRTLHTHLVFKLELPLRGPDDAQDALNLEPEASFLVQVKNTDPPSRGRRGGGDGAGFRWLQYELLLVAASDDEEKELGLELEGETEEEDGDQAAGRCSDAWAVREVEEVTKHGVDRRVDAGQGNSPRASEALGKTGRHQGPTRVTESPFKSAGRETRA